jgi:ubiquinone/menaquinone biosynthesis C-methylase UbiE
VPRGRQLDVFLKGEGDAWFKRNEAVFGKHLLSDSALLLVKKFSLRPKKVLDVGCSNGWRLDLIRSRYGSTCVGLEPSKKALRDGKKRFPKIRFVRGTASSIPLKETFDLVIVNFVLHWVSRDQLMRSLAEIDRMVIDGGHLLVCDHYPNKPLRTKYHHLPKANVWTYKAAYADMFEATALYRKEAQVIFRDSDHKHLKKPAIDDRGNAVLMKKSYCDHYFESTTWPNMPTGINARGRTRARGSRF